MLGFAALARALFLDGRRWALLGASAAFGYLAITRPVYQVTAPTLAAFLGLAALKTPAGRSRARLLRTAVILPVGTIAIAGSLALYQQSRFSAPESSVATIALAAQLAAYVEVLPPEEPLREILVRHRDAWLVAARHHRPEGYIFRAWPELVAHFDGDERRTAREVMRLNRLVIRREPRAYLLQVWRSFGRYWEWFSFAVPGLRAPWSVTPFLLVHFATTAIFWALLGGALVAGAWVCLLPESARARWRALEPTAAELGVFGLAAVAVLLHMLLQCALGIGEPRYRLPSDPLTLVACAVAMSFLYRTRRQLVATTASD
jgi:hypothetical protein